MLTDGKFFHHLHLPDCEGSSGAGLERVLMPGRCITWSVTAANTAALVGLERESGQTGSETQIIFILAYKNQTKTGKNVGADHHFYSLRCICDHY